MQNVSPNELHNRLNDNDHDEILIDVREPFEFQGGAIPNAKNIPLNKLADHIGEIQKYATVYVNCGSGVRSQQACQILESHGIQNVINLDGGIGAWKKAGLVINGIGKERMPLIRQVMLTAGILNALGILAALFFHPAWIFLALLVACGLTFAGISGICFMSYLLALAPWNRD